MNDMNKPNADLISQLAGDLEPVNAYRARDGVLTTAAAVFVTIALVAGLNGLWSGPLEGTASPYFYIANGLLGVFGIACAVCVVRMASPGVGNRYSAAYWTLTMIGVLPLAALASLSAEGALHDTLHSEHGLACALSGTLAAVLTAAALTVWLRRGAPVDPVRAGLLTGLASGALGSVAYGLSCPLDSLGHLALWHVMPVALCGIAGRLAIPGIVRW